MSRNGIGMALLAWVGLLAATTWGAKPVAEVVVDPASGLASEFAGDIENFGTLLRSALAVGGVLDVVDRSEHGALVKAREFSVASSAEKDALQSGMDAASNYRIVTKVSTFERGASGFVGGF